MHCMSRTTVLVLIATGLIIVLAHLVAHDRNHGLNLALFRRDGEGIPSYRPELDPMTGSAAPLLCTRDMDGQPETPRRPNKRWTRVLLVANCTPCVRKTLF